ncbi:ribonuclease 2-like [Prosopis cineraria]|uniref:ribonuclease 2-like n=1 Tax=Prosopis cineraria TaxID=364024 RepID=UPI00240F0EE1|nr:ribonuclease 2-like [Prosopis cineraria]
MASFSAQTRVVILPWLLLAAIVDSICAIEQVNGSIQEGQREFDYFALALQWPGTYCRRTRHCCSFNACCRGSNAPTEFTIHGLWPDYNDGTWPSCCSRSYFDPKEISTLTNALDKYWPSLSCGSPSTCHGTKGTFWAHEVLIGNCLVLIYHLDYYETNDFSSFCFWGYHVCTHWQWEKHGTCSFPVFRDEYNYFLTTLNVYFKYNVTRVLNEAGFVPSNREKYPLGGITSAIENAFHTSPQVVCSHGALQEIRLCFYKDFKPRDCVVASDNKIDMVTSKSLCPKYVSLPEHVSSERGGHQGWFPDNEAL